MWIKMHKQSDTESCSHRKATKATMVEGINPITTKKIRIKTKILAITFPLTLLVHPTSIFISLVILSLGTLSSGVIYVMLRRPNKAETAVQKSIANILSSIFVLF